MRIAKKGFETVYETLEAKQKALANEKAIAIEEACAKVDAEYVEQEELLNSVLTELSDEIPDPIPETEDVPDLAVEGVASIGDYDATPQFQVNA
jgi:hypothetical protein